MRKALALSAPLTLAFAAVAVAAGPTITVTVTPDTPSAQSTLKVSATGPFSQSGLPKSLKLTAQKGFQSSAKSVPVRCDTGKVPQSGPSGCPSGSKIGSGKVVANVTSPPLGTQTVPFTMYLGKPKHTGDIAAIILSANVPIVGRENTIGRLFKTSTGKIEILFNKLPSAPSSIQVTVKRLEFSAHAVNGTHSLITNPPSCKRGHWTGSFALTFSSGTVSSQTSIPCST